MDSLHLAIAIGPLAIYLLLIGGLNLFSRPLVTTGGRDLAALGIAIGGFVMVGPMELFMPEAAAMSYGPYVWMILISLYGVSLSLIVMMQRPRLVIYNVAPEEFRSVLGPLVKELDPEARWAGDNVSLPNLDVQFSVESTPWLRNMQLAAAGGEQNFGAWRMLETALAERLADVRVAPNAIGMVLVSLTLAMFAVAAFFVVSDQQAVAQALKEMFRL